MAAVATRDALDALTALVESEDYLYEERIAREPYSVSAWLQYIRFKANTPRPDARVVNLLHERALAKVPMSYKLWRAYLDTRIKQVRALAPSDTAYEAVNRVFKRALVFMHRMPRVWEMYTEFLVQQHRYTAARHAFDDALRALPVTQHERIWNAYLDFAQSTNNAKIVRWVYSRFMKLYPDSVEDYIEALESVGEFDEACVQLSRALSRDNPPFASARGASRTQLWLKLCELMTRNADHIHSLDVERVIRSGLRVLKEDAAVLWIALADYSIRLANFEKARDVFEEALNTVVAVRDFGAVWDAYTRFEDELIGAAMQQASGGDGDDDEAAAVADSRTAEERAQDFDLHVARYEHLVSRQPFLLNSVLLRQNKHDVHAWQKRAALYAERDQAEKVIETYTEALQTVDPSMAEGKVSSLWVNFAAYYEEHGDTAAARSLLERGIEVEYASVNDASATWCALVEFELRQKGRVTEARALLRRALHIPSKAAQRSGALRANERLFRSTRMWCLLADLEESYGTLDTCRAAYDAMLELGVATPQVVLNYAALLESHHFYEDAFRVYERGIKLFKFPFVFDIWTTYLTKFVARYGGRKLERARDLFEQVCAAVPAAQAQVIYVMYANLEERFGLARHAMSIYERGAKAVSAEDRLALYALYAERATEFFGVTRTRQIYESMMDALPDEDMLIAAVRYAQLERRLGEVDRARAILTHAAQYADPGKTEPYWQHWHEFEVLYGNEDTFREFLRVKRTVQVKFGSAGVNLSTSRMLGNTATSEPLTIGASHTDAAMDDLMAEVERKAEEARRSEAGAYGGGGGSSGAVSFAKAVSDVDASDFSTAAAATAEVTQTDADGDTAMNEVTESAPEAAPEAAAAAAAPALSAKERLMLKKKQQQQQQQQANE